MSRQVALMVVMLAGCHEAKPVVVEPRSPERPLTLSAQTVAAWEAFCVRPSCPDCDLPRTSVDAMAGIPDAEDPEAVIAWIRSQVPEIVGSTHGSSIAGELWFRYDALPPGRRAELLPELRMLARHESFYAFDPSAWTHEAWLRLAALRDPEILPLLRTALADAHDWGGQLAAAEALREYGEDAGAPEARALYDAPWDPRWPVLVTEVQTDADGVTLRNAFTLLDAPEHYAVQDDRLLLATTRGVAVVSADLTQRLLPYATERTAPTRPPERYQKLVQRRAAASKTAIEACLEPLRGRTSTCHRRVPPGVGLWLEVDEIGAVTATVPFTQHEDPRGRPPAPEVAACLSNVTRSWTFDPAPQGWTSFGYVFNLSAES